MNDIPLDQLPPNAMQSQRSELGNKLPPDDHELKSSNFLFTISPFNTILTKEIRMSCNSPTFGLHLKMDEINQCTHIEDITNRSSAGKSLNFHRLPKNRKRETRGSHITAVNGTPVFDKESTMKEFLKMRRDVKDGLVKNFTIDIAPLPKTPRKTTWKECDKHDIFVPNPLDDNSEASINIDSLKSIAKLRYNNLHDTLEPTYKEIILTINALRSTEVTPEEQALGRHARRKLKTLENWPDWLAGERKQLDQFYDLQMCGEPCALPPNGILLRSHWKYQVRQNGDHRSRQCCDGSKRAAPMLHAIAKTHSLCVKQPIQRLFIALSAQLGHALFGGDAKDAHAHSPPPECPTFVQIDDAYADWYENKFGKKVNRRLALPVQHALQGHPESGRPWEEHINKIITDKTLNFRSTTHDKCIYYTMHEGHTVLMSWQVDDFLLSCKLESVAKHTYNHIGKKLQSSGEQVPPFKHLSPATDCNGVDINQTKQCIETACPGYVNRLTRAHGWDKPGDDKIKSRPTLPMPENSLDKTYTKQGPLEGSKEYKQIQKQMGFACRTLLGEPLYAHVT